MLSFSAKSIKISLHYCTKVLCKIVLKVNNNFHNYLLISKL